MYGRKMSRKKANRKFKHSANRTHKKNVRGRPMRGGIRL